MDTVKSCFLQDVAPPSVFYGHNVIELRCVGMASSATRYYRKGQFCDQFFTKLNDTEFVTMIGNPE